MTLAPLLNQTQNTRRQTAFYHLAVINRDDRLKIAILRVKMRTRLRRCGLDVARMERSAIRGGRGFSRHCDSRISACGLHPGYEDVVWMERSGIRGPRLTLQSPPSAGARCGARQVPVNSFGHGRLHTVGVRSGKPWSVPYFREDVAWMERSGIRGVAAPGDAVSRGDGWISSIGKPSLSPSPEYP